MSNSKKDQRESVLSENRYMRILDTMAEGCQIISPEWKYVYVNEAAAKHGNQTKEKFFGAKMMDVYPQIEDTEVFRVLRQCMEHREQHSIENEFTYPDGSKRWFNLNIQPDPEGLFITSTDITERKQVKEEVAQIFTKSMDMLCIADIHTATFTKVNPAFTEILGFSEAELLGKPFLDFIHPDDIDETRSILEKNLQMGEKVINFDNRYQCKDGKYRWLSWVSHPNIEEGVTFAVARDITEHKEQESALAHSKAILDATGRMAKVGGWELNVGTMEVTWTEETYRIHELPFDQKPHLQEAIDFFHPEDRPKLETAIQCAFDFGEPYDLEIRFITAKGKHLWTRTICRPELLNGKVIKLMGTFQDITDQKQVKEALEESKAFLDNMSDIAYITDDQGNLVWANFAAKRITGFLPEQIIGKPFLSLFIEEDHASLMDVYQKSLKGEELENTLTFKTGTTCHLTILPKRNKNGDIIGTFGVARDITEKLRMEQALKDSEQMYRTTFDAIPDSITVTRQKDGKYKYVNDGFYNITGYSHAEVIGKTPSDINLYVNQSDRERMVKTLQQNGELLNFEIPFRKKDGTIWDSFFSARPIVIDGEDCLIALTKDVTELKKAEGEKNKLEAQLRQAQKMESVGRLAGGVAHDFNNMLSVILGNTDMILEEIDADVSFYFNLHEIQKAARRSADITRQLLAFARKQTIAPQVIDLNETLTNMLNMLKRLIGEDIKLVWLPVLSATLN